MNLSCRKEMGRIGGTRFNERAAGDFFIGFVDGNGLHINVVAYRLGDLIDSTHDLIG